MRKKLALLSGLILLLIINVSIFQKEQLLAHGQVVLLELAPVDPRSLMQGDYMALNYTLARTLLTKQVAQNGIVIVERDAQGIGHFRRLEDGSTLADAELRLRYRVRDQRVHLATDAFFFQEGLADRYEQARYGEFRVDAAGNLLLTHLRNAQLQRLGLSDVVVAPKLD